MNNQEMANIIMCDLVSLKPYYYCKAVSGSIYIKFADKILREEREEE